MLCASHNTLLSDPIKFQEGRGQNSSVSYLSIIAYVRILFMEIAFKVVPISIFCVFPLYSNKKS